MLTVSASSSQRSERVQKKNTSPASSTDATTAIDRSARPRPAGRPCRVVDARARRRARSGPEGNTVTACDT